MLLHLTVANITVVPQLIGVLMAAAMNFHMYFTVFNSSAHNYCPVLLIITQKCGVQVDPIRSASRIRSESRGFAVWVIYVVT